MTKINCKVNVIDSFYIGCGIRTNIWKDSAINARGAVEIDFDKCKCYGYCLSVYTRVATTLKGGTY